MKSMGAMFDWEREIIACLPDYYKWSQWFFKQFYEKDLAYRSEAMVNWSETLQTVLANEQVIDGKDERTGQPVVQKLMEQWFFAITKYADELLKFDNIDWPEPIKMMQTKCFLSHGHWPLSWPWRLAFTSALAGTRSKSGLSYGNVVCRPSS